MTQQSQTTQGEPQPPTWTTEDEHDYQKLITQPIGPHLSDKAVQKIARVIADAGAERRRRRAANV